MAGDEDQEYMDNPNNHSVCSQQHFPRMSSWIK
ncbi:hypothetical protein [Paenibacillus sp. LHD-117]